MGRTQPRPPRSRSGRAWPSPACRLNPPQLGTTSLGQRSGMTPERFRCRLGRKYSEMGESLVIPLARDGRCPPASRLYARFRVWVRRQLNRWFRDRLADWWPGGVRRVFGAALCSPRPRRELGGYGEASPPTSRAGSLTAAKTGPRVSSGANASDGDKACRLGQRAGCSPDIAL